MIYDVVVYLSSLPRIADRNRKTEVLKAFVQGAQSQGAQVLLQTEHRIVPARMAVILGWVGSKIRGPHIQLRRDLIQHQTKQGHKLLAIDASCFKFADPASHWLRYSLDGVYYNSSNYANANSDDSHWQQIKNSLGVDLKPWRSSGDHVLLCLQRDGGWSMKGFDLQRWAKDTACSIRSHSDRPILVRCHPKYPVDPALFRGIRDLRISANSTLQQDLEQCWASVYFNSSACVASVLAGVPVFASDDDCVAWRVSNHDISCIENPTMPDRQQWLWDLSAAHWNDQQSRQGLIYNKFLPYI